MSSQILEIRSFTEQDGAEASQSADRTIAVLGRIVTRGTAST